MTNRDGWQKRVKGIRTVSTDDDDNDGDDDKKNKEIKSVAEVRIN